MGQKTTLNKGEKFQPPLEEKERQNEASSTSSSQLILNGALGKQNASEDVAGEGRGQEGTLFASLQVFEVEKNLKEVFDIPDTASDNSDNKVQLVQERICKEKIHVPAKSQLLSLSPQTSRRMYPKDAEIVAMVYGGRPEVNEAIHVIDYMFEEVACEQNGYLVSLSSQAKQNLYPQGAQIVGTLHGRRPKMNEPIHMLIDDKVMKIKRNVENETLMPVLRYFPYNIEMDPTGPLVTI